MSVECGKINELFEVIKVINMGRALLVGCLLFVSALKYISHVLFMIIFFELRGLDGVIEIIGKV